MEFRLPIRIEVDGESKDATVVINDETLEAVLHACRAARLMRMRRESAAAREAEERAQALDDR